MADWSANHRACVTTWSTLFALAQLTEPFPSAGTLRMADLLFFNGAATPDQRRQSASALAVQVDNIFRLLRNARYEDGVTRDRATDAMVDVLVVESRTLADLAAVTDACYRFWGEGDVHLT